MLRHPKRSLFDRRTKTLRIKMQDVFCSLSSSVRLTVPRVCRGSLIIAMIDFNYGSTNQACERDHVDVHGKRKISKLCVVLREHNSLNKKRWSFDQGALSSYQGTS